jgi:protein-export SecD/SecF family membrane protein
VTPERLERYHRYTRRHGVNWPLYLAARALMTPFFLVYFRYARTGREHARVKGGLIVAANHRSFLDPFAIGGCLSWRRPMNYVAKVELFERRWQGWVLSRLGAFPIRRGESDEDAMETARLVVERGGTVCIFPEGTRIRTGSLAAPMDFIEERTIGPSLGADNIRKGFDSTIGGFSAIAVFMSLYYVLFGLVSVLALASNLVLLVALLSLLQATLTLPGIAAVALTLGMAVDANVLINERIREELRNGETPQAAIKAGYERAFGTILDSNITTLIAGIALLIFGSGPVRGFAVVHCLGILTSIFSSVVMSRAAINFIYGTRRRVESLSIGQVWKPGIARK